jgi:hypothetical protein
VAITLVAAPGAMWFLRSKDIVLRLKQTETDGHIRAAQREQAWYGVPMPKARFGLDKGK